MVTFQKGSDSPQQHRHERKKEKLTIPLRCEDQVVIRARPLVPLLELRAVDALHLDPKLTAALQLPSIHHLAQPLVVVRPLPVVLPAGDTHDLRTAAALE